MKIEQISVLDASDPVSKAINEISKTGLPVVVMRNKKYVGLIDERAIRHRIADISKEKCESVAEKSPVLEPEASVLDASKAFFAGRFKAIPVIKNGKVFGAITRRTLLSELLSSKFLSKKRVSDVMSFPVATIDISSTIGQARSELRRHNIRRLVVTKNGRIAGILSVFDLAFHMTKPKQAETFYLSGAKESIDDQPVSSYMKEQVETVQETETLASAVKKMLEKHVSALVVSEGGYPRGIVTAKDIFHTILEEQKPARVFVSGLHDSHKDAHDYIVKEGEKLIQKVGKSFPITSIAFHVKTEGAGFLVRAKIHTPRKSYNASASDFRLEGAIDKAIDELRLLVSKDKKTGVGLRRVSQD
ncbi:MAG: CBS domain-containing protein [Candidatus Micrarchaeota archaeon]|nr:CBS domain-containing protein [Candidatus Micrarchaeota archaeon]